MESSMAVFPGEVLNRQLTSEESDEVDRLETDIDAKMRASHNQYTGFPIKFSPNLVGSKHIIMRELQSRYRATGWQQCRYIDDQREGVYLYLNFT